MLSDSADTVLSMNELSFDVFVILIFSPEQTEGAADWEFFTIRGNNGNDIRYFLGVANLFSIGSGSSNGSHIVNSRIYELNLRDEQFVLYQEIQTNGYVTMLL